MREVIEPSAANNVNPVICLLQTYNGDSQFCLGIATVSSLITDELLRAETITNCLTFSLI